jgi:hypothetical protein
MDKQKISQLTALIRQVVNEELEAIIPEIVGEIKKAVDARVQLMTEELRKSTVPPKPPLSRKRISEIIGAEFDGETIRASTQTMKSRALTRENPEEAAPLSTGNPSEDVVRAITRNYSDVMARLNAMRPDVKGVYRT